MKYLAIVNLLFAHAFLSFSGHAGKFETMDGKVWEFDPKTGRYSHPRGRFVSEIDGVYGEFKVDDKKLHCLMICKVDGDGDRTFDTRTFGGALWQHILFKPLDATMDLGGSGPRFRVNEPPADGFERFIEMYPVPGASSLGDYDKAIVEGRIQEKLPGEWVKLTDDYLEKKTREEQVIQSGLVCFDVRVAYGRPTPYSAQFGQTSFQWESGGKPCHHHTYQTGQVIETKEQIFRRSIFSKDADCVTQCLPGAATKEIRRILGSPTMTSIQPVPAHGGQCPAHPGAGGLGGIGGNTGCLRKQL